MKNIKIRKIRNIRTFNDLKNVDGLAFKSNFFYRGGKLQKINKRNSVKLLKKTNIKEIIDLRTDSEISEKPDYIIDGVKYTYLPLYDDSILGITHEKKEFKKLDKIFEMKDVYYSLSKDEYLVNLKTIIDYLLKSDEYPILFHCTEGKDRTGIISLIILSIFDFTYEEILRDYLYTNKVNRPRANMYYILIRFLLWNKKLAENIKDMTLAKKSFLDAFIEGINEKFGTLNDFIKDYLGISDEYKEELKERFLE